MASYFGNITGGMQTLFVQHTKISCPADTTQDTLATFVIPKNTLGPNGSLFIYPMFSMTGSTNNKTMQISIGGVAVLNVTINTNTVLTYSRTLWVSNRNSTGSQIVYPVTGASGGNGTSTVAVTTPTIDFTTDLTLLVTGQKASSGEALALEQLLVQALP